MQINHCLILAAGLGTRMGALGQKLPKVLWPVFEKSLLELQIAYAKSLGAEKIYINLHHMNQEIMAFCRSKSVFQGVTFLREEPEILDIGGAVHNLASLPEVNYEGKLLVLNADQFFYLSPTDFQRVLEPYAKSPCVLFSYWVNSSQGYNALQVDGQRLVRGITKNSELDKNKSIETYTGISVVDLSQLKKIQGKSSFFETVAPFGEEEIPAVLLENVDYWDFGTVKRYWETMFRILRTYRERSVHPFIRFLVMEKAMKTWKINLQDLSYHAKSPQVINLNPDECITPLGPSIILHGSSAREGSQDAIWWNEVEEIVS